VLSSSSEYTKIITSLEKIAKTTDEKIIAVKNAKGAIFHIIYSKSEDVTDSSKLLVMFLTKTDGKFYINGISIQFFEDTELKNIIIKYLDNLTIFDLEKTHV